MMTLQGFNDLQQDTEQISIGCKKNFEIILCIQFHPLFYHFPLLVFYSIKQYWKDLGIQYWKHLISVFFFRNYKAKSFMSFQTFPFEISVSDYIQSRAVRSINQHIVSSFTSLLLVRDFSSLQCFIITSLAALYGSRRVPV